MKIIKSVVVVDYLWKVAASQGSPSQIWSNLPLNQINSMSNVCDHYTIMTTKIEITANFYNWNLRKYNEPSFSSKQVSFNKQSQIKWPQHFKENIGLKMIFGWHQK